MSEPQLIRCVACGTANRVPRKKTRLRATSIRMLSRTIAANHQTRCSMDASFLFEVEGSPLGPVIALRFLYRVTLQRDRTVQLVPTTKNDHRLPAILSPQEVLRLLQNRSAVTSVKFWVVAV